MPNAKWIKLKFLYSKLHDSKDSIEIRDGNNYRYQLMPTYAKQKYTLPVMGDMVEVRLISDNKKNAPGFYIEKIRVVW